MLLTLTYPLFVGTLMMSYDGIANIHGGNIFNSGSSYAFINSKGVQVTWEAIGGHDFWILKDGPSTGRRSYFMLTLEEYTLDGLGEKMDSTQRETLRNFLPEGYSNYKIDGTHGKIVAPNSTNGGWTSVGSCLQFSGTSGYNSGSCSRVSLPVTYHNINRATPENRTGVIETLEVEWSQTSGCVTDGISEYPIKGDVLIATLVATPPLKVSWKTDQHQTKRSVPRIGHSMAKRNVFDNLCFGGFMLGISWCPGKSGSASTSAKDITRDVTNRMNELVTEKMKSLAATQSKVQNDLESELELTKQVREGLAHLRTSYKKVDDALADTMRRGEDNVHMLKKLAKGETEDIWLLNEKIDALSAQTSVEEGLRALHVWMSMRNVHNCTQPDLYTNLIGGLGRAKLIYAKDSLRDLNSAALETAVASAQNSTAALWTAMIKTQEASMRVENGTIKYITEEGEITLNMTKEVEKGLIRVQEALNANDFHKSPEWWIWVFVALGTGCLMGFAIMVALKGGRFHLLTTFVLWSVVAGMFVVSLCMLAEAFKRSDGYRAYTFVKGVTEGKVV